MNNGDYIQRLTAIKEHRCTPENIQSLLPNEIFVFGTDPQGEHKSGAAKLAVCQFGAKSGIGEGLYGQSYAIPVHKHRRELMVHAVKRFIDFAKNSPDKRFYVLAIGCGAAGMDPSFVALMFRDAIEVENIYLPKIFIDELVRYYKIGVQISDDCMTIISFLMHYKDTYVVPYGVECLGESAFMGCSCNLELPMSLKKIERWAFCDMGPFDYYLRIPSSVMFIDDKAFEAEWVSPGMLVNYQSYAYDYAKKHNIRYKCIDFDEENYLKEKQIKENISNRSIASLHQYIENLLLYPHPYIPKGQIAVARDFAFVLNDDSHLTLLGHNDSFQQLHTNEKIVKVAAAFSGYMGLTESGRVITGGSAHEFDRTWDIEKLRNVNDIVSCEGHTVAVLNDGSVECIDESSGWEGPEPFAKIVRDWHDIKQVAVGFYNIMGLTNDGRVLYSSNFYDVYDDIVQIDCYSHYYGQNYAMVLHRDGTVSSDTFDGVETWRDIIQISVGADIAIGLKKDGTIEMVDYRDTRYAAKEWKDLVCVECKFFGVVGITSDGRILSLYDSF